ncbi:MAG: aldo/keto reductase [Tractidigestivibacter sp.]|jgi:aryl-alcohol dehydrogenase-like predicted oxidoreductase|uniref:aldo/keto reductase n=1 Tax=Tractidigestivibacter sp. TaxID=2847320 RepID=UPI003D94BAE7
MKKRVIGTGSAAMEVSAVGFGCMGLSHAYGAPTDEKEGIDRLREAVEIGYTFFDTAEMYGTPDDPYMNERLVGKAFEPIRDKVKIATKFGIRFDTSSGTTPYPIVMNSTPERIRESVEGSLKRLRTDHIDLYYQHRIDPNTEPEVVAGVMADLIKEGKILHWGISQVDEDYLRRAHAVCPVTAVENRYSMMARAYEPLFPALEELGVSLVAFSPLANGLLSGKYGKGMTFDKKYDYRSAMPQFTDEAMEKNQQLLDLVHKTAEEHNATDAQISLAWMMCRNFKPGIVPIPGTRKVERMRENAAASEIELSFDEVSAIDAALDEIPMSGVFGEKR